jgi:hypothetical protein
MRLSNHEEYAQHWGEESAHLDAHDIYERLAGLIPAGRVLEIGCGTGRGTAQLVRGRAVLALDNNAHLIAEARRFVGDHENAAFCRCDLFDFSETDLQTIADYRPSIIAAWFIGGSGSDVYAQTSGQPEPIEKGKIYREKVEDLITSSQVLLPSVETISLVNRSGRIAECSDDEVIEAAVTDYNTHVFDRCGFAVSDVQLLEWPRDGSKFRYGAANNPNLAPGTPIPTIISISATRL